jgi:hypothetical protein
VKKARAMQLLKRASSLRLKAMTQPGRQSERKRGDSMLRHSEVLGLLLTRHPGMRETDVVQPARNDAEAEAGEASGLPVSTM